MENPLDPHILGKILLLQSTLHVMPGNEKLAHFVCQTLKAMPGIAHCALCIEKNVVFSPGASLASEIEPGSKCPQCTTSCTPYLQSPKCFLAVDGTITIKLQTIGRQFGRIVFTVDNEELFAPYKPYLENTANLIALLLENRYQEKEWRQLNSELEHKVAHRTQELAQSLSKNIEALSQLQQVEKKLRREKNFAERLIETAPIIIMVLDTNGYIVHYNEYMQNLIGYTTQELADKDWHHLLLPEQAQQTMHELFTQAIAKVQPSGTIIPLLAKSSNQMLIEWYLNFLRYSDEDNMPGILAVGLDVTERQNHQEQLQHYHRMEAIGQLAGGVAHDFNNQLQGIIGYADLLCYHLQDNSTNKYYAQMIVRSAQRSASLTKQLLAFARKGKHLNIVVAIHDIIAEVVMILKHTIDKKIAIKQSLHADVDTVMGDPSQLQNALLNIAINARDAMAGGGELIFSTKIIEIGEYVPKHLTDIKRGTYLQICVVDSGVGIEPAIQQRIFEPFFTTKSEGLGMGLAAVYGIVKNHGGTVHIDSQPGKGSTFSLYLPVVAQKQQPIAENAPIVKGKANILLVDDEEIVRKAGQDMLIKLGYQVMVCKDGFEAITYYRDHYNMLDLVILDMVMPKMSGKETYAGLQAINPQIKVILASGYSINKEVQSILNKGQHLFVQKPFRMQYLAQAIAKLLANQQSQIKNR